MTIAENSSAYLELRWGAPTPLVPTADGSGSGNFADLVWTVDHLFLDPRFGGPDGFTYTYAPNAPAITYDGVVVVISWDEGGAPIGGDLSGVTTWTSIGSSGNFTAWWGIVTPSASGDIILTTHSGSDSVNTHIQRLSYSAGPLTVSGSAISDTTTTTGLSADAGSAVIGFYMTAGEFYYTFHGVSVTSDALEARFSQAWLNPGGGVVNFTPSGPAGDEYCAIALGINN